MAVIGAADVGAAVTGESLAGKDAGANDTGDFDVGDADIALIGAPVGPEVTGEEVFNKLGAAVLRAGGVAL